MPGPRRFRTISATAIYVTVVAAVLWGIALWAIRHPLSRPALTDDQFGAAASTLTAALLWTGRWLANFIATGGIVFMIDAMLSQRTWYRRRLGTATAPQRKVSSPRHAR